MLPDKHANRYTAVADESALRKWMRISGLILMVGYCAIVLALLAVTGWESRAFLPWSLGFPLVLGFSLGGMMLFLYQFARMERLPHVLSVILGCVLLFGSSALVVGCFLTEPARDRLQSSSLVIGLAMGLCFAWPFLAPGSKPRLRTTTMADRRKALRWNLLLSVLVLAMVITAQAFPRLKWGSRASAGLAVTSDGNAGLWVDFYGRGVNQGTVQTVLDGKIAPGYIEQLDLFGSRFQRGFVPSDLGSGPDIVAVRRIAFHRTDVRDSMIPLLKQFSHLRRLDLRGTRITEAGIRQLRSALPACEILR